jgi:hypothetical protein
MSILIHISYHWCLISEVRLISLYRCISSEWAEFVIFCRAPREFMRQIRTPFSIHGQLKLIFKVSLNLGFLKMSSRSLPYLHYIQLLAEQANFTWLLKHWDLPAYAIKSLFCRGYWVSTLCHMSINSKIDLARIIKATDQQNESFTFTVQKLQRQWLTVLIWTTITFLQWSWYVSFILPKVQEYDRQCPFAADLLGHRAVTQFQLRRKRLAINLTGFLLSTFSFLPSFKFFNHGTTPK